MESRFHRSPGALRGGAGAAAALRGGDDAAAAAAAATSTRQGGLNPAAAELRETPDGPGRPGSRRSTGGSSATVSRTTTMISARRSASQSNRAGKKRKEPHSEEEDDGEDNNDAAMSKKPRVVWSVELHRKFVAVVNQLGMDKAVPKRILELMNVEKLTRENVASHLQRRALLTNKFMFLVFVNTSR